MKFTRPEIGRGLQDLALEDAHITQELPAVTYANEALESSADVRVTETEYDDMFRTIGGISLIALSAIAAVSAVSLMREAVPVAVVQIVAQDYHATWEYARALVATSTTFAMVAGGWVLLKTTDRP